MTSRAIYGYARVSPSRQAEEAGQSGELAAKQGRFHTEVTEKAKPPRATEKVDSASLEVVHFVSLWPLVA
jgi:hypothetical protein